MAGSITGGGLAFQKVPMISKACLTCSGLLSDAAAWKITAVLSAQGLPYVAVAAAPADIIR